MYHNWAPNPSTAGTCVITIAATTEDISVNPNVVTTDAVILIQQHYLSSIVCAVAIGAPTNSFPIMTPHLAVS